MDLLLDTHAFLWYVAGDKQLPDKMVSDGFRWFQVVSDGFRWFQMVTERLPSCN